MRANEKQTLKTMQGIVLKEKVNLRRHNALTSRRKRGSKLIR